MKGRNAIWAVSALKTLTQKHKVCVAVSGPLGAHRAAQPRLVYTGVLNTLRCVTWVSNVGE